MMPRWHHSGTTSSPKWRRFWHQPQVGRQLACVDRHPAEKERQNAGVRGLVAILGFGIGGLGLVLIRNETVPIAVGMLMQVPLLGAIAWLRANPPEDGGGS